MNDMTLTDSDAAMDARAAEIRDEHLLARRVRVDRMFCGLLVVEWVAGIIGALVVSPYAWEGKVHTVHLHVWVATLGGAGIIILPILLAIWISLNCVAWFYHWDVYPFVLLNLVMSFQSAYAAPIIMMSQNRAALKDRLVAEVDHQVNVRAEVKTGLIMNRLDDIERSMHFLHSEQATMLKRLRETTT